MGVDKLPEQTFGEFLRIARKKQGITQQKLADMTGFTTRVISYWETGRHEISLKNADVIAKALGITISIGSKE